MEQISRRKFFKTAGLFVGGLAIAKVALLSGCGFPVAKKIDTGCYSAEGDKVDVLLDKIPELYRVGDSAAIINDNKQLYLIIARIAEDRYVVALNQCPHRERQLGYDPMSEYFVCASGKSKFRLDGSVVSGSAERPLSLYKWQLEQNRLIIYLPDESSRGNGV